MATGRLPDPNTAPVTAKGDLYTYSTVPAKLAVGNNGETLVADSSATTGLRWQGDFAAGKNKVLNSDFLINQRSFSSTTSANTFGLDRWTWTFSGGTNTYSVQSFTPGSAPVAGYEGRNFARVATSGQSATSNYTIFIQRVEDVTTFANQTTTFSFWAKANSGTPKVALEIEQLFGTGGSPSGSVLTYAGQVTLSTSWARYSITFNVPTISGKTLGTAANSSYVSLNLWTSAGSDFNSRTGSIGLQNNTIDFWGVQWEAGSVATAFQTATGTLAGELAAAMRYCEKFEVAGSSVLTTGQAYSTTAAWGGIQWTVQKRATPTITQTGTFQALQSNTGTSGTTFTYASIGTNNARMAHASGTGLVAGNACIFQASGDASLLITAEL